MGKTAQMTITFLVSLTREDLGLESDIPDEEFKIAVEEFMKHDFDYNDWEPSDLEMELI